VSADRVAIAGAGPVGLSLALGLARHGVRVDVFEQAASLSTEARASTLHPPTLEMFAAWGVIDEVLAHGAPVDRLQYWERETRTLVAEFPYTLIANDTQFPFRFQCPQHVVTPILRDALERTGHGHVHFECRAREVRPHARGAELVLDTPGGERRVAARYVCGADGARSAVRQSLGLSLDGTTYEDRFLLVGTDLDFRRWFPALGPVGYVFDPDEWVIIMHLPDLVRTVFRLRADEDADAVRAEAAIRARMRRFLGEPAAFEIKMRAIYSVHQRVAERFRVGDVLLLGDAAHVNNPAGGMGMNSGIHDAFYLASALVAALVAGDDRGLDAWADARRRAALDSVQRSADANYRRLTVTRAEERRARNAELTAVASDPTRARRFLLQASMLEAFA
jgi:3-(3-hydroxy-phenyl)propionate hydroxylase